MSEPLGDAENLKVLQETSGLSWEQLSKLFGVGRRTLHLWANGGRMSQWNREQLYGLIWLNKSFNLMAPAAQYRDTCLYDILSRWREGHLDISGEWSNYQTPSCAGRGHLVKGVKCDDCP